ncbi:hypothetical protein IFM89_017172 [Coptis chinensis]|uniref:ATP-dependent (S)-NAD(P)H-hydrate dehydratase n=1 Tax=Coptis chinensis TaxID=261450 RepID=A0A835HW46_9MAGN|nr:hypothetical protein IFM89_017172 [Coptis chinensis]
MLASSSVLRRQQFLIRCLGVPNNKRYLQRIQGIKFESGVTMEVDAENIIRRITPILDPNRHKGQAGKVAVIGGCREYTGAPYFAAISALKIGADLSHVFCTKDAAAVIKGYSPELIVHPILEESYSVRDGHEGSISRKVLAEVDKWMERFDCVVVGPGLGRDPFLLDCVSEIIKLARRSNVPIVIDGDGLFLVTNSIDLVSGYPLAVLTPNVNEYKRLVQKVLGCEVNDENAPEQLISLARSEGEIFPVLCCGLHILDLNVQTTDYLAQFFEGMVVFLLCSVDMVVIRKERQGHEGITIRNVYGKTNVLDKGVS